MIALINGWFGYIKAPVGFKQTVLLFKTKRSFPFKEAGFGILRAVRGAGSPFSDAGLQVIILNENERNAVNMLDGRPYVWQLG